MANININSNNTNSDNSGFTNFGVWNRDVPWETAKLNGTFYTGREVLKAAKLDWTVVRRPVFVDQMEMPNKTGLVRQYEDEDGSIKENILGIVSKKGYSILQNVDAFDYLDSLVGERLSYVAAGQVKDGRRVFMVAQTEKRWKVGDDDIGGNLLLSNGHDGLHTLRIAITPVRIFCMNCLPAALRGAIQAKRCWSIKHRTNFQTSINSAREALRLTGVYMENLQKWGENLIAQSVSISERDKMIEELFPVKPNETPKGKTRRENKIDTFRACLNAPDLSNYTGTAWAFINAVSDYETHRKQTSESLMNKILNESLPMWNKATAMLNV